MKELIGMMQSFSHDSGKDIKQVMSDLLTFIIGNFNPEPAPDPTWRYTNEQNKRFHEMFVEYVRIMNGKLKTCEWYDAWGDMFMELTPKGGYKGQFFTPVDICDLMAQCNIRTDTEPTTVCGAFGKRVTVSDPTAGSGRNLLASYAMFVRDKVCPPFLVAEDIDPVCCKMCAVNMLVHGCFGEVVCHNTLSDPKGLLFGYIVNEGMYPLSPGIPTIRLKHEPEWFVSLR